MVGRIESARATGELDRAVKATTTVRMTATTHDLATGQTKVIEGGAVPLDPRGVEREYRRAARLWPDQIADEYLARRYETGADLTATKGEIIALTKDPDALNAVESTAAAYVRELDRKYRRRIDALHSARRAEYDELREQSVSAEETRLILPDTVTARPSDAASSDQLHLYADRVDGMYPHIANGWEREILDAELGDPQLLGWYRNPSSGRRALRVPYVDTPKNAVYPDFVFFHRGADGEISVSIVDPHGTHLADGVDKLHALASYAQRHGKRYARIDAVAKGRDGRLLRLNLVRVEDASAALSVQQASEIEDLFERLGTLYC